MITGADTWHDLADHGQHVLRCPYQLLAESRTFHGDELAVILAGGRPAARQPGARRTLPCHHRLSRLRPAQLTAILRTLAAEAGLTLTPDAARKAVAVLAEAENGHATGNARLAVQLLTQAPTNQAYRITTSPQPFDPAALAAICGGSFEVPRSFRTVHPIGWMSGKVN